MPFPKFIKITIIYYTDQKCINRAFLADNASVVKYLLSLGARLTGNTYRNAYAANCVASIDCLLSSLRNKTGFMTVFTERAFPSIEMVEVALKHGFSNHARVANYACQNDCVNLVPYLQIAPFDLAKLIITHSSYNVLKEVGRKLKMDESDKKRICLMAIAERDIDLIKALFEYGFKTGFQDEIMILNLLDKRDYFEITKFLIANYSANKSKIAAKIKNKLAELRELQSVLN